MEILSSPGGGLLAEYTERVSRLSNTRLTHAHFAQFWLRWERIHCQYLEFLLDSSAAAMSRSEEMYQDAERKFFQSRDRLVSALAQTGVFAEGEEANTFRSELDVHDRDFVRLLGVLKDRVRDELTHARARNAALVGYAKSFGLGG